MLIYDKVYGNFDIKEPVLIELLNSKALNRLKGSSMGGYYPAYPIIQSEDMSRYNHSIGVFLLLRKIGARIEEQIAGLIHDISHSAFSHTIDYIKETTTDEEQKNQSGQDDIHENFIKNSDVNEILTKHGFDIDYILDDKNFTLKENNVPDICADRIDYSIRQGFVSYNIIGENEKNSLINSLINHNGSFIFKDFENARFFAKFFWKMDEENWSGIKSAVMFAISGKLFQIAIKNKYIEFSDFYRYPDAIIINKIIPHLKNDSELKKYYDDLNLTADHYTSNPDNYIRKIFCKIRRVDPQFLQDGKLLRVSDLDGEFKKQLETVGKFREYFVQKIEENK